MVAASKLVSLIVIFASVVAIGTLGFGVLQAARGGLETISEHLVKVGAAAMCVSIVGFLFSFATGMPIEFTLGL